MAAVIAPPTYASHRRRVTLGNSLSGVWTTARLTLTEAMRRRFWIPALAVGLFYVLLGFFPIHPHGMDLLGPVIRDQFIAAVMGTYGATMIEFFCFLFAVALSAGAISAELERGTLSVIVPKPLPRWAIYTGKWLGVNLFLAPYLLFLTSLLQWALWMHIHKTSPNIWHAMGVMYLYPLLFTSLTLMFSSFAGNLLATIIPLIFASTAWSENILRALGYAFDVDSLKIAAKYIVYVVPLNPMSRWLERAQNFSILQVFPISREHPWPPDPPANLYDLGWILGYAGIAFLIGLVVFQRRDL